MIVVLKRLWLQLTADRRKFGVFCAVLAFGLLFWARIIVISNVPRTAIAEPGPPGSTAPSPSTPAKGGKPAAPAVRVALDPAPRRDPFEVPESTFPRPTPVEELQGEAGKSPRQPAEDPQEVEARLRAQLRSLVDQLTLDAVMSSASLAVINGETYRRGRKIPANEHEQILFELAEVRQRSVVLEYQGRRFELELTPPMAVPPG